MCSSARPLPSPLFLYRIVGQISVIYLLCSVRLNCQISRPDFLLSSSSSALNIFIYKIFKSQPLLYSLCPRQCRKRADVLLIGKRETDANIAHIKHTELHSIRFISVIGFHGIKIWNVPQCITFGTFGCDHQSITN